MHIHTLLCRAALTAMLPFLTLTVSAQGSNDFGYPVAPDTTSSLQAPVGSIGGSLSVSSTGGATYTMPIEVPKGVSDSEPSLAITYNSQSGNGLVGYGCNLTGLSAITRVPTDIYRDGKARGIIYDALGTFCLDGQRLMPCGTVMNGDSLCFYLEFDPHTKVVLHGLRVIGVYGVNQNALWFSVLTPDGVYHEYGYTTDSKQSIATSHPGFPIINSWYVSSERNPRGATRQYSYINWDNTPYLQSLSYGNNVVRFGYEQRPDTIKGTVRGVPVLVTKRLASVTTATIVSNNDSIYRQYSLHYINNDQTTTGYSRLDRITVANGDGEELRPTTFNWDVPSSFSCQKTIPYFGNSYYNYSDDGTLTSFFAADFDGDGLTDIAERYYYPNTQHTYIRLHHAYFNHSTGEQFFYGDAPMTVPYDYVATDWQNVTMQPMAFDVDGDGINELISPFFNITPDLRTCGYYAVKNGYEIGHVSYDSLHTDDIRNVLWSASDFNNDGRCEMVVVEKEADNQGRYYAALIGGYTPSTVFNKYLRLYVPYKPKHLFSVDMNNDGLTDIVVFYDSGYSVFLNDGHWMDSAQDPQHLTGYSYSLLVSPEHVWVGDFNGDGLVDFLIGTIGNGNYYFGLNNGDKTITSKLACTLDIYEQNTSVDDNMFCCRILDMDGDGKSDVVLNKCMYPIPLIDVTVSYWLRSDGNHLSVISSAFTELDNQANPSHYITGDFDGNGISEVASMGYDCYDGYDTQQFRIYRNGNYSPSKGKITALTNGLGAQSLISYKTTGDHSVYSRLSASEALAFPVMQVSAPLPIVSKVTSDNGASGQATTNYSYKGLQAHVQGRGMLGMTSTSVQDSITGKLTRSWVKQWHPDAFVPTLTRDTTTLEGHTASQKTQYVVTSFNYGTSSRSFRHRVSEIKSWDFYGNLCTEDYAYYYVWSFPCRHSLNYNNQSSKSSEIFECVYKCGQYLPTIVGNYSRHENDTLIWTLTHYAYNNKGLVDTLVNYYETNKEQKTIYTYDAYGNPLSKKISGGGITLTTDTWQYDSSHRFVTKHVQNGITDTRYTHDLWGNVLTETDRTRTAHPLTQTYTYDGWGRQTGTVSPIGLRTTCKYGWGPSQSMRWFTVKQGDAQPWVKTWYDSAGRKVKSESIGSLNLPISNTVTYNNKGQVSSEKSRQGDIVTTTSHTYDYQGRVLTTSLTDSLGTLNQTVSYNYGSNWKSETRDGRTTTTTYDSWGNPLTVVTPQDTVSYTYCSLGKPVSVTSCGRTVTMEYDHEGNQTRLTDPDAGTMTYTYDGLGRITSQTNARNQTQNFTYDSYGRKLKDAKGGATNITYTYGTTTSNKGLLLSEAVGTIWKISYQYDNYGRVTRERRDPYKHGTRYFYFTYNNLGQVATQTYPNGITVSYQYDAYGNHVGTTRGDTVIWRLESSTGSSTQWQLGSSFHKQTTVNAMGQPTTKSLRYGNTSLRAMTFTYNNSTGNLTQRTGMLGVAENFTYDAQERLTGTTCGSGSQSFTYAANGNITSKTDIGGYYYEGTKPHAVTSIDNDHWLVSDRMQTITYNPMGKATSIKEVGCDTLTINYGGDGERWKSVQKNHGNQLTTLYFGDYEERTDSMGTESICYLDGGVMIIHHTDGTEKLYVPFTDHLGSYLDIYNENAQSKFRATYDAWGRQTIHRNDIGFHRGYTGHEMLPEFGLINMNGRLYDPLLGRFLSTDDYVQAPFNSQNFNRYSYCLNNPLKYTDPDGEVWWIPLLANICMNAAISRANGDGLANGAMKGLAYSAISMAGSYASNFIGNLFGHQLGNLGTELFRSGAHGLIQGTVSELSGGNFLNGFAAASLSSLTGSGLKAMGASSDLTLLGMGTTGAFASQFSGGNYIDGFMTGISLGMLNHEWEILPDGTPHCIMDEVVVIGHSPYNIPTLRLIRIAEKQNSTISKYSILTSTGESNGYILERGGPETLISGINRRIPEGEYYMQLTWSPNFNRELYLIYNDKVSKNRGIRLHEGNYYYDSHGCLLPGQSYGIKNNEYMVNSSRLALKEIMNLLNPQKSRLIIIDSIR